MTSSVVRAKFANRFVAAFTFLVGATVSAGHCEAQVVQPLTLAQVEDARSPDAPQEVRFSLETVSRFGNFIYVPGQWGEFHLRLENGGTGARDLLCSSYFDDQSSLQFGRRVWLPARSRLSISHPVFLPKAEQLKENTAVVHSLVLEQAGDREVLVKSESGQLRHERTLSIATTDRNTGVVAGWKTEDVAPPDVLELISATRVLQGLNDKASVLASQFLPADESSLNYLDHLVLAEDRLIDDFAALAAVRRWLHAGGRLWIMLDRTDPILLERLFGDDFDGHLVDRVELTSVRIDQAPSFKAPNGEPGETVEYEQPVDMARIVVSGVQVWNTVDGWPAAMTTAYGEGRVLITTLGARGWFKPAQQPVVTTATQPLPAVSGVVPVSPLEDLSAYVLAKREPAPLPEIALAPLAQEHISYQVPTWTFIVGVMCGFLGLLIATAVWLWRREHLEHFGWIGSLIAVGFGVLLTGMGMANRYGVPSAVASVQLAQAVSGTDDVRTHGVIGVYRPEVSEAAVETEQGGRLWPDMQDVAGATIRMVTSDLGTFRWDGLEAAKKPGQ